MLYRGGGSHFDIIVGGGGLKPLGLYRGMGSHFSRIKVAEANWVVKRWWKPLWQYKGTV